MAFTALSLQPPFCYTHTSVRQVKSRIGNPRRTLSVSSGLDNEPIDKSRTDKENKEKRQLSARVFTDLQKLGRGLKENMSPQRKGDWKDLMLMSFSFAVYVYMSQKIVCAYFAWMSMPRQSW